jgi:AAHS family 4-hydroxybenzoate transporter-like MFS transporter
MTEMNLAFGDLPPSRHHTSRRSINLDQLLDRQSIGLVQIVVVGLCLLAMLIDGYDVYMFGIAVPSIAKSFAVAPVALTRIIVAQNVGLVVGVVAAGPLSDRYGRKPIFILCIVAFGLLTLATAHVHTLTQMAVLRFAAAIFFAGVVPNAIALTGEMAPLRYRSGLVAFLFCGYSGGTAIAGLVNGALLAAHGWPVIFLIGGILPLCLVVPFMLFLPESLRFRARRDPRDPHIARMLTRIDPSLQLDGTESFVLTEDTNTGSARTSIRGLFVAKRRAMTLLLWAFFALSLGCVTTVGAWAPTVFNHGFDLPIAQVGVLIGVYATAGVFGTGTSGFIMDRIGAGRAMFGFYIGCAIFMLALAVVNYHGPAIYVVIAIAGYCVNSAQGALNAFSSSGYPTRMRATGVGGAFGAGRAGGIVGPIIGGQIIAGGHGSATFFAALAVPFLLVALLVPALIWARRKAFAD